MRSNHIFVPINLTLAVLERNSHCAQVSPSMHTMSFSSSTANTWESSADHPRCSAVEEQLQCPVCFHFMYLPFIRPKVNYCFSICRAAIGEIRSLALEKVAGSLSFPCAYHKAGCSQWLRYDAKRKHEETCIHRPFNCPFPGCPLLTDNAEALATHLRLDHGATTKHACEIDTLVTHLDLKDSQLFILDVYRCFFEQYFYLQCELVGSSKENIVISLVFIGEEMDAKNYYCCLEVGNGGRKMICHGSSRSIREGCKQKMEDGLVLHRSMAGLFAEGDGGDYVLGLRVEGSVQLGIWRRLILFCGIFWLFVVCVCGVLSAVAGLTEGENK